MDEQENEQSAIEQPEKKRRGRPSKIIQSGVTIIDTTRNVEAKEQGTVFTEEPKKKRGRKPKVMFKGKDLMEGAYGIDHKLNDKKTVRRRKSRVRSKPKKIRNKKGFNFLSIISKFKMPKIKIDLSGIKLPKGLTWHDVQIWSVAMAAIIAIALAK